jgi:DNA-binding SARP family transcriptional activator
MTPVEERPMPWAIRLLGGFDVTGPCGRVEVPPSAQRLVAFLALHGQALSRTAVASQIWPDAGPTRALANLRNTLWRLGAAASVVTATSASLVISPGVVVDLVALEQQAAAARTSDTVVDELLRGFDLNLLPGWDEEWVELERERVRQLELYLLDHLVTTRTTQGRHGEAVDAALRAVRLDPLREASQAALLRALLAGGDRVAAVSYFRRFAQVMQQELGLPPSRELIELVGDLLPSRAVRRVPPQPSLTARRA